MWASPTDWVAHNDPAGRLFFRNTVTNEVTWADAASSTLPEMHGAHETAGRRSAGPVGHPSSHGGESRSSSRLVSRPSGYGSTASSAQMGRTAGLQHAYEAADDGDDDYGHEDEHDYADYGDDGGRGRSHYARSHSGAHAISEGRADASGTPGRSNARSGSGGRATPKGRRSRRERAARAILEARQRAQFDASGEHGHDLDDGDGDGGYGSGFGRAHAYPSDTSYEGSGFGRGGSAGAGGRFKHTAAADGAADARREYEHQLAHVPSFGPPSQGLPAALPSGGSGGGRSGGGSRTRSESATGFMRGIGSAPEDAYAAGSTPEIGTAAGMHPAFSPPAALATAATAAIRGPLPPFVQAPPLPPHMTAATVAGFAAASADPHGYQRRDLAYADGHGDFHGHGHADEHGYDHGDDHGYEHGHAYPAGHVDEYRRAYEGHSRAHQAHFHAEANGDADPYGQAHMHVQGGGAQRYAYGAESHAYAGAHGYAAATYPDVAQHPHYSAPASAVAPVSLPAPAPAPPSSGVAYPYAARTDVHEYQRARSPPFSVTGASMPMGMPAVPPGLAGPGAFGSGVTLSLPPLPTGPGSGPGSASGAHRTGPGASSQWPASSPFESPVRRGTGGRGVVSSDGAAQTKGRGAGGSRSAGKGHMRSARGREELDGSEDDKDLRDDDNDDDADADDGEEDDDSAYGGLSAQSTPGGGLPASLRGGAGGAAIGMGSRLLGLFDLCGIGQLQREASDSAFASAPPSPVGATAPARLAGGSASRSSAGAAEAGSSGAIAARLEFGPGSSNVSAAGDSPADEAAFTPSKPGASAGSGTRGAAGSRGLGGTGEAGGAASSPSSEAARAFVGMSLEQRTTWLRSVLSGLGSSVLSRTQLLAIYLTTRSLPFVSSFLDAAAAAARSAGAGGGGQAVEYVKSVAAAAVRTLSPKSALPLHAQPPLQDASISGSGAATATATATPAPARRRGGSGAAAVDGSGARAGAGAGAISASRLLQTGRSRRGDDDDDDAYLSAASPAGSMASPGSRYYGGSSSLGQPARGSSAGGSSSGGGGEALQSCSSVVPGGDAAAGDAGAGAGGADEPAAGSLIDRLFSPHHIRRLIPAAAASFLGVGGLALGGADGPVLPLAGAPALPNPAAPAAPPAGPPSGPAGASRGAAGTATAASVSARLANPSDAVAAACSQVAQQNLAMEEALPAAPLALRSHAPFPIAGGAATAASAVSSGYRYGGHGGQVLATDTTFGDDEEAGPGLAAPGTPPHRKLQPISMGGGGAAASGNRAYDGDDGGDHDDEALAAAPPLSLSSAGAAAMPLPRGLAYASAGAGRSTGPKARQIVVPPLAASTSTSDSRVAAPGRQAPVVASAGAVESLAEGLLHMKLQQGTGHPHYSDAHTADPDVSGIGAGAEGAWESVRLDSARDGEADAHSPAPAPAAVNANADARAISLRDGEAGQGQAQGQGQRHGGMKRHGVLPPTSPPAYAGGIAAFVWQEHLMHTGPGAPAGPFASPFGVAAAGTDASHLHSGLGVQAAASVSSRTAAEDFFSSPPPAFGPFGGRAGQPPGAQGIASAALSFQDRLALAAGFEGSAAGTATMSAGGFSGSSQGLSVHPASSAVPAPAPTHALGSLGSWAHEAAGEGEAALNRYGAHHPDGPEEGATESTAMSGTFLSVETACATGVGASPRRAAATVTGYPHHAGPGLAAAPFEKCAPSGVVSAHLASEAVVAVVGAGADLDASIVAPDASVDLSADHDGFGMGMVSFMDSPAKGQGQVRGQGQGQTQHRHLATTADSGGLYEADSGTAATAAADTSAITNVLRTSFEEGAGALAGTVNACGQDHHDDFDAGAGEVLVTAKAHRDIGSLRAVSAGSSSLQRQLFVGANDANFDGDGDGVCVPASAPEAAPSLSKGSSHDLPSHPHVQPRHPAFTGWGAGASTTASPMLGRSGALTPSQQVPAASTGSRAELAPVSEHPWQPPSLASRLSGPPGSAHSAGSSSTQHTGRSDFASPGVEVGAGLGFAEVASSMFAGGATSSLPSAVSATGPAFAAAAGTTGLVKSLAGDDCEKAGKGEGEGAAFMIPHLTTTPRRRQIRAQREREWDGAQSGHHDSPAAGTGSAASAASASSAVASGHWQAEPPSETTSASGAAAAASATAVAAAGMLSPGPSPSAAGGLVVDSSPASSYGGSHASSMATPLVSPAGAFASPSGAYTPQSA